MAEMLTPQQQQAVHNRGGNLLVSAAAGSGKTKVLVDRLIGYLMDPINPANIDDFLIITYTKAAASELREKIANKLTEKIAENPGNRHLHRQLQRLYLTTISTVHAFCTEILRQYAYLLDLPGDFSVIDDRDAVQLQALAMEQVLEQAYSCDDPDSDFLAFIDSQGFHRNDRMVPEIIMDVSEKALCHLQPDLWMDSCIRGAEIDGATDASQTPWGKYLIDDLRQAVDLELRTLHRLVDRMSKEAGFENVVALFLDIIYQLEGLKVAQTWDQVIAAGNIHYGKLTFSKQIKGHELTESIKKIKEACAQHIRGKLEVFCNDNAQVMADLHASAPAVRGLISLVRAYHKAYSRLKRGLRTLDFSDLEHFTLDLFYGKSRSGITAIADEIAQRYRQIMVDEYQDSNAIQDAIFEALSHKKHNLFMVGDVKQSIYSFRLADPDIFLDKYNRFAEPEAAANGEGRKVMLSSNFRSGGAVLNAANDVFSGCMTREVGGLNYGPDEMLIEGIPHTPLQEPEIRLLGIQVSDESNANEARMVAGEIRKLLDGTHMVRDKDTLRPARAEDIVILLRSPGSQGYEYKAALEKLGISCWDDKETNLFDAEEICVLRSLMTVISNPRQDIPLIATIASPIFGFTANDLAELRAGDRNRSIHDLLAESNNPKAIHFWTVLSQLRKDAKVCSVAGLLEKIYLHTNLDAIYNTMEDGQQRMEHLETFYSLAVDHDSRNNGNLELFLSNLDIMEEKGLKLPAAQQPDSVRIFSIHKSKGLEFPIVFLCGLSKRFNTKDLEQKVLMDKELGIGLCCTDQQSRICYPNIAKSAICANMWRNLLSEEMRILYVAMTRPKDRLIMTYSFRSPKKGIVGLALRMSYSDPVLLHSTVSSMLPWVLYCALQRTEAGQLFALGGRPERTHPGNPVWDIQVTDVMSLEQQPALQADITEEISGKSDMDAIRSALTFSYPYVQATKTPSKQTATQLKERFKDAEISQYSASKNKAQLWRTPSFMDASITSVQRGNAMHAFMQYVQFEKCLDLDSLCQEVLRLQESGLITQEQAKLVDVSQIMTLFSSDLGKRILDAPQVLREFKFSVLVSPYENCHETDRVLLQGVVDCALLEPDGITVIDFKTDRVRTDTLEEKIVQYTPQVNAYARAVTEIFQMPVKKKLLYFFELDQAVAID